MDWLKDKKISNIASALKSTQKHFDKLLELPSDNSPQDKDTNLWGVIFGSQTKLKQNKPEIKNNENDIISTDINLKVRNDAMYSMECMQFIHENYLKNQSLDDLFLERKIPFFLKFNKNYQNILASFLLYQENLKLLDILKCKIQSKNEKIDSLENEMEDLVHIQNLKSKKVNKLLKENDALTEEKHAFKDELTILENEYKQQKLAYNLIEKEFVNSSKAYTKIDDKYKQIKEKFNNENNEIENLKQENEDIKNKFQIQLKEYQSNLELLENENIKLKHQSIYLIKDNEKLKGDNENFSQNNQILKNNIIELKRIVEESHKSHKIIVNNMKDQTINSSFQKPSDNFNYTSPLNHFQNKSFSKQIQSLQISLSKEKEISKKLSERNLALNCKLHEMELNYNKMKKFQNSLRRDANQCEQFTQTTIPNSKQIDVSISQTHILENTIKSLENQLKLNLKNQSEYEKLKLNYEKNFKESKDEQDVIKNENIILKSKMKQSQGNLHEFQNINILKDLQLRIQKVNLINTNLLKENECLRCELSKSEN